jgi:photosystem II stability/assembly factor-like uncharacterized protein
MKKVILCLFVYCSILQAQWVQTNGPGSRISCIDIAGNNLFVVAVSSIYLTTDNGIHWTLRSSDLPRFIIHCIAVSDSNIFIGFFGVYRSTNNGLTWFKADSGLPHGSPSALLAFNGNVFSTVNNTVYRSTNNGSSWSPAGAGLPSTLAYDFTVSDSSIFLGTDSGLYRSASNGENWTRIGSGIPNIPVYTLSASLGCLLAGTSGGIYRSTDCGSSWSQANSGLPVINQRAPLKISGELAFVGVDVTRTIFVSTDSGLNWKQAGEGVPRSSINSFAINGTNIYAACDGGVYLSTDSGSNWSLIGVSKTNVDKLAPCGKYVFAVAGGDDVHRSTDGGLHWKLIDYSLQGYPYYRSFCALGKKLFAGTNVGICGTTDNGQSWTNVIRYGDNVYTLATSGEYLFAGTTSGVLISSDTGTTWNSTGLRSPVFGLGVSKSTLFAGASSDPNFSIHRSTDNGITWSQSISGLSSAPQLFVANSSDVFVATYYNGVYRSTNNGLSWTPATGNLSCSTITGLVLSDTTLFISTVNGGIFRSNDKGSHWVQINEGLINTQVLSLSISDSFLLAGTFEDGIWRRSIQEILSSVEQQTSSLPQEFVLFQNYPNPFNPSTTIAYSLAQASPVKLTVYNALVQVVAVVIDRHEQAGRHTVNFDASHLPSGLYFMRLNAGTYTQVRKMIVLK